MTPDELAEQCAALEPGHSLDRFLDRIGDAERAWRESTVAGQTDRYLELSSVDTKVFTDNKGRVRTVVFGPDFPAMVAGIRISMSGDTVVGRLGEPERPFPMPHPNYVLLYDSRRLRVDVDRSSEKVIRIYRT